MMENNTADRTSLLLTKTLPCGNLGMLIFEACEHPDKVRTALYKNEELLTEQLLTVGEARSELLYWSMLGWKEPEFSA
jgi:hypothetical protein